MSTTKVMLTGSIRTFFNDERLDSVVFLAFVQIPNLSVALLVEMIFLLIPSTRVSSSTLLKQPLTCLYEIIFCALALPIPLSSRSCEDVALLISTSAKRCVASKKKSNVDFKIICSF